ncbi:MAG: 3-methyl-2-oxobutanoate hydroxymethyltransferase [Actinomycetia bacterium]|nr:3-methyl-2-oxobutanoate hydroxymethyltransferase [Actinomycetes bacterium]
MKEITTSYLKEMKSNGEKIVMLTAYDYLTAKIIDSVGIEIILVGDSLGMVFGGEKTTLSVTLDQMIYHTGVVSKAVKSAMVVGDMPFLSYQVNEEEAIRNAGRFLKEAGAKAVKLEGGEEMAKTIERIVNIGIPVMGHIGLTPQSIHQLGGFKVQGKSEEAAEKLLKSAKTLEQAGVFSLVLECVPSELSQMISESVSVPTIGIGAGLNCDGQVLVTHDLLGITESPFKFLKKYGKLKEEMERAYREFYSEVKEREFPDEQHSFFLKAEVFKQLKGKKRKG